MIRFNKPSAKKVHFSLNKRPNQVFYKKHFKDVSREFDEFQVNIHLCKLRCWHLLVIVYYMSDFLLGGVLFLVHRNEWRVVRCCTSKGSLRASAK